jgi:hypothetical protein
MLKKWKKAVESSISELADSTLKQYIKPHNYLCKIPSPFPQLTEQSWFLKVSTTVFQNNYVQAIIIHYCFSKKLVCCLC